MRHLFPEVVSYNRFVEPEREIAIPLILFIKKVLLGKCTGISFVDSTPLRVCKNQRIHIHKTFKGIAQRGKCSMGWFFVFKLHLICNEKGELLNFMITPGDVDDREPLKYKTFVEFIYGKLVGDKGDIGKHLFEILFVDGIQLITKLKINMKGALMSVSDKLLIRKRAIIETVTAYFILKYIHRTHVKDICWGCYQSDDDGFSVVTMGQSVKMTMRFQSLTS